MVRGKGCRPCKLRRKKCDERKPECEACVRNVLVCTWGSLSDVIHRVKNENESVRCATLTESRLVQSPINRYNHIAGVFPQDPHSLIQGLGNLHPQLRQNDAGFLYTFFLEKGAQAISVYDKQSNPFIHILIPIALQSDIILHAVLAFSGVVFLRRSSQHVAHTVWTQYAQTLRSLKHKLTQYIRGEKDLAVHLLFTSLLLCALEVSNADRRNHAFLHLVAAQKIISTADADLLSSSPAFSLAAELYFYNVALLSGSLTDFPEQQKLDFELSFRSLTQHRSSFTGVLCGPSSIFPLIPEVYSVCAALYDALLAEEDISLVHTFSRQHLLSRVLFWNPGTADNDCTLCDRIYQLALLALLDIRPVNADRSVGYTCPARCHLYTSLIGILEALPVESHHTTILCWPLAVLGAYAEEISHRNHIRDYMTRIADKYRLGNMYQIIVLLDYIWVRPSLQRRGPRSLLVAMEELGYRVMFV